MKLEGRQKLVRVYIGEQDRWKGAPLYQAIVDEARRLGLAGATVLKGFMGYGCKAHVHTAKLLELSSDLPIVVEIVDADAKIQALLPRLHEMVTEGLATLEDVDVIVYRADPSKGRSHEGG